MFVVLLGVVYPSLVMGLANPLVPSDLEESSFLSQATPNETITCTFDGFNYSLISPPLDNVTCEGLMRGVATTIDISSNDRSVVNIVWSCLATIFACTWVSLHPDIPHPDATEWHVRLHRFSMMLVAIIAPELIVLFALQEWLGARTLVKEMKEEGVQGFTMVHGHFMQMGGFIRYSNGARGDVITDCHELKSFIHDRNFTLPVEAEILDKSKGDGLSKALAVGQCGWFILQLLSRWFNGLAITEIELVTLAFSALSGIIYFFWWKKPLNVRYGVHIALQMQGKWSFAVARFKLAHGAETLDLKSSHNEQPVQTISPTYGGDSAPAVTTIEMPSEDDEARQSDSDSISSAPSTVMTVVPVAPQTHGK